MRRRRVLASLCVAALPLAGCLDGPARNVDATADSDADSAPEHARLAETGRGNGGPLADGLTPHGDAKYAVALFSSRTDDAVDREYLREHDGAELLGFLDATAFDDRRVLALQARHSSTGRRLDLESLTVESGDRLDAAVSTATAEGGGDAEYRETVFVRVDVGDSDSTVVRLVVDEGTGDEVVVRDGESESRAERRRFDVTFEPGTADGPLARRERVVLANVSDERQYMGGYSLAYGTGYDYAFSGGLTLEPRAKVAVVSRGSGDSVAEADPPTYYLDADLPELVLAGGEETVRLLNLDGEVVAEETYEAA